MKKTLIAILILCGSVTAQTTRPPQPNYTQYGSCSRQLRAYRNVQAQLDADSRRRYRKFREEIRHQVIRERPRIVQRRTVYQYGDAMRVWRERRCRSYSKRREEPCLRF